MHFKRIRFKDKQHAHVEIVTVTDADLIHIELAIVNNMKKVTVAHIFHNF